MKLVEMKCKNCGNKLKLEQNQIDVECDFCHAQYKLDNEVQHIKYDDMEQAGYEMEKGKIRARKEAKQQEELEKKIKQQKIKEEEQKKKNLKWWILGWIFMFPIPLTILIWRTNWGKKKKIIFTVILWIIILILGYANQNETPNNNETNNNSNEVLELTTKEEKLDNIVIEYNKLTENKLIFKETFEPQDKTNTHYRTEFRLYAYKNSLGKSYTLNEKKIDIIVTENMDTRIYADNITLDETIELIKHASLLLDPSITNDKIDETINYVKDNKYANGYYYGELGLLLSGNEEKGFNLMIKND